MHTCTACTHPLLRAYRGLLAAIVLAGLATMAGSGCSSAARRGWLGLNTQMGEAALDAGEGAGFGQADVLAGILKELNVPLVRDTIMNWAIVQPEPSRPCDFASSDQMVRVLQTGNTDILIVFRGVPAWAAGDPNARPGEMRVPAREQAPAFVEFVRRFVERYDYDGRSDMPRLTAPVRSYQFLYEMEDIPPSEYAWWLRLFHATVKAADPQAVVVLGGLSSPGLKLLDRPTGDYSDYFERLLAEPELTGTGYPYFDVAAFHCFPARYPGRSAFDEQVAYLRKVMAEHQLALPIWLTAYGVCGGSDSVAQQEDNLVKWTVKAPTLGIERVYLCGLRDGRDAGCGFVGKCGLLQEGPDGQIVRKPVFHAFAKLLTEIQERPDVSFRGEGVYVLTGSGKPRYVIWKEESYQPAPSLMNGWWSVETMTGPKVIRQGSEIRITASPMLLERTTSPFID